MAQMTIPSPMPRDSDKARACPSGPSIATVWLVGGARIVRKTLENHRYNIYRKCEVDGVAGLMRHAIQQGLVSI